MQQFVRRRSLVVAVFAVVVSIGASAQAQEAAYPSRTIRIISGFAPGGGGT